MTSRATVIDNPDREYLALIVAKHRLQFEIRTGTRFRVSTMSAMNERFGWKCRTKKQCLEAVEREIARRQALRTGA